TADVALNETARSQRCAGRPAQIYAHHPGPASVDLAKLDRHGGQRRRCERLVRPVFDDRQPIIPAWAGIDPGDALVGIDDPIFLNTMARVDWRLDALVIGKAGMGNLNHKTSFPRIELSKSGCRLLE